MMYTGLQRPSQIMHTHLKPHLVLCSLTFQLSPASMGQWNIRCFLSWRFCKVSWLQAWRYESITGRKWRTENDSSPQYPSQNSVSQNTTCHFAPWHDVVPHWPSKYAKASSYHSIRLKLQWSVLYIGARCGSSCSSYFMNKKTKKICPLQANIQSWNGDKE